MFAISLQRKYYKKSILLVIFFIFISCFFEMIPQNKAKQKTKQKARSNKTQLFGHSWNNWNTG